MDNSSTITRQGRPTSRLWLLLCLLLLTSLGSPLFAYDLTVAQDGSGTHTTVQAAINAAPTGRTAIYSIFIKNGIYREKISIPSNKPFIQLVGESVANTILTYNDGASTPTTGGGTVGTQGSASFSVNAPDFSAFNITFGNSFGDGSQAVAVLVQADRAVFKNCRFLGNQDTLYIKGSGTPMHYFRDCYIDGNVDFIFGSSVAIFDRCIIYAKSRTAAGASYITAANTPPGQTYGFIFRDAKLPSNTGGTLYYLGRPWQNSTGSSPLTHNKTVFLKSIYGFNQIQPAGWVTWDTGTDPSLITYAEYRSRHFNGNLVNVASRVSWSRQLAPADTAAYQTATVFGSWNPCAVDPSVCTAFTPDIAVSNFRAVKGATQTNINWNISWAMTGIQYEVLRSSDNVSFTSFYTTTATNDSTYNFQTTDGLPAPGTAYYYKLRASKAGLATHTTPVALVSSIPTLTTTGSLGTFAQFLNTPSAVQTYTLSGSNLTANVSITPPASYEVSADGGATWFTSTTPLVLTPTANTLANTTISVRLNAAAAGSYAGDIVHSSTGATTLNVAVSGSRVNVVPVPTVVLEQWPLTANNTPSITAAGVLPTTPTFLGLALSDGSTGAGSIAGYSTARGQAFAPNGATGGGWTTAAFNRNLYEEFTVVADAGYTLRADSLIFSLAFNNSANGRVGVSYSTDGFTTINEVTGGVLPAGGSVSTPTAQPATATGAFTTVSANQTLVPNRTAGPTVNSETFRLAFNSTTGVPLTAGQTLTFRLYLGLGSTSAVRQAQLKAVSVKGTSTSACNATFAYGASTYCLSGSNPTPSISGMSGGTFSSTTGLSLNGTTGAIDLAASTPGTYTVTYAASGTCSSTSTVTITAAPTATFTYANAAYCLGSTNPTPTVTGQSGTFSAPTGLAINAGTGAINLAGSTAGTYLVTNTVAAAGGCAAATATFSITLNPATTATFNYPAASFCRSASNPAPTVTGTTGGSFTSTTGLSLTAGTGAINLAASTPGTYTVTYAVAGPCPSSSTATISITAPATATFSYPAASYCTSLSSTVSPTVGAGSTAGTFSSTTGLTLNTSTGVITPGSSTPGTYAVTNTVAAAGGCAAATATFSVTINATPTAPTVTVQYNGATTTLTSSATTGNQWYLNGTLIPGATNPTYVVNGSAAQLGSYTVVATGTGGCASAASAPLVVTDSRAVLAGTSLSVYPNPAPNGQLTVALQGYRQAVELTLINSLGQSVLSRTLSAAAVAGPALRLELRGLAAGVYVLRVATAGGLDTRRVVVR